MEKYQNSDEKRAIHMRHAQKTKREIMRQEDALLPETRQRVGGANIRKESDGYKKCEELHRRRYQLERGMNLSQAWQ